MKKLTALIFATILIMTVSAGFAEPIVIDGMREYAEELGLLGTEA